MTNTNSVKNMSNSSPVLTVMSTIENTSTVVIYSAQEDLWSHLWQSGPVLRLWSGQAHPGIETWSNLTPHSQSALSFETEWKSTDVWAGCCSDGRPRSTIVFTTNPIFACRERERERVSYALAWTDPGACEHHSLNFILIFCWIHMVMSQLNYITMLIAQQQ